MPRTPESFHPFERDPLPASLETWLRESLRPQYKAQVEFLRHAGLLELLPEDPQDPEHHPASMGIIGIDGKPYSIPTPEAIQHALTNTPETGEMYATKIDQGFTDLQLTPFAKPLAQLEALLRRSILQHHKDTKLFSSDGVTSLDLDTNQPLYVWDGYADADTTTNPTQSLVYFPERFDPKNHGGTTKQQIMHAGGAWQILLLEPDPTIPREGHAPKAKGNRKRLEANSTPNDYLKTLQTNPIYSHESGLTLEDWHTRFLKELHANNRVLNDWSNPNDSLNYLLASYHPASGLVLYGYWLRDDRQAYVGGDGPEARGDFYGVCPAVRIRS